MLFRSPGTGAPGPGPEKPANGMTAVHLRERRGPVPRWGSHTAQIGMRAVIPPVICIPTSAPPPAGSASLEASLNLNAAAAKSLQSCPTLCDPMDCSLPGSSIHGIFQATVLEWGANVLAHQVQGSVLWEFLPFSD